MKNLLNILILLLLLTCATYADEAVSPDVVIKTTVDELVSVVESMPGEANAGTRRAKMREIIEPKFDFEEMSRRSLGAHWNEITTEQKKEFVDVFSELLAKTYLNKIDQIEAGMVAIAGFKVRDPKALVKTTVRYKEEEFPLDYKMVRDGTNWQVYDVVIENIGLVTNYRNEFAGILRKDKFSELLDKLKRKLEPA